MTIEDPKIRLTKISDSGDEVALSEIQARIYMVRGEQVMIDRDLAILYGVENRVLRQAVRRNINKFPEDFLYKLSGSEAKELIDRGVSQNVIPSGYNTGGMQLFAFTEQGVAMLSTVLKSASATAVSVAIMRAFVAMRRFLTANAGLFQRVDLLEQRQVTTEKKLDVVLDRLEELSPTVTTEQLFATGCIWDAYTFVCDLIRSAKKKLVLIDNFVNESVLTMLDKRNAGVAAIVHTRYTEQVMLDFEKHNKQYEPISYVQLPHAVHDRYLIVDDEVWLLGTSVKDMGRGLCTVIKVGFKPEDVIERLK
jgi:hypothetical protein